VLALAVAARVDFVVSGDNDLLVLGAHGGIPIVTPSHALDIVGG
jgi:predicted nucleic acid-binding protein